MQGKLPTMVEQANTLGLLSQWQHLLVAHGSPVYSQKDSCHWVARAKPWKLHRLTPQPLFSAALVSIWLEGFPRVEAECS